MIRPTVSAAALLAALAAPAALAQGVPTQVVAIAAPASGAAELTALRQRAWRDDAQAQMGLAMRLGDAHRRGADESSLVEAAYWAGRAWQHAPSSVAPDAMASFFAAHCGSNVIASHWVCTEGE